MKEPTRTSDDADYVSLTDAAALLGVSRWTLYRRVAERGIPLARSAANHRVRLVRRSEVEAMRIPRQEGNALEMWIVANGEACSVTDGREDAEGFRLHTGTRLWAEDYGREWLFIEASDELDARRQAALFDARLHPAQTEMERAAAAYRAGERWLQTADVTA